jgi:hypothetical protein
MSFNPPAGTVLQLVLKPHARNPLDPAQLFVESQFPDLEQALIAVANDELIFCKVLYSHKGSHPFERIVHKERIAAFRGGAIDRVELPSWRFVRETVE